MKKMKKHICQLIGFMMIVLFQSACSQTANHEKNGIKWMGFEEAVSKSEKNPKKLLIDVYTSWCGWCKRMDQTTYQDTALISYINKNYYAVKLDAETKDTLHFRDKNFVFRSEYKANELALSLLGGKMGYPTTVFLDEKMNLISVNPGYMDADGLGNLLRSLENGK